MFPERLKNIELWEKKQFITFIDHYGETQAIHLFVKILLDAKNPGKKENSGTSASKGSGRHENILALLLRYFYSIILETIDNLSINRLFVS